MVVVVVVVVVVVLLIVGPVNVEIDHRWAIVGR